jgi:hypothetical protein
LFTGTKQDLETFLNIVHQIFGGIRIVEEILADGKLDGLVMGDKGERFRRVMAGTARIHGRSGRWAVVGSGRTGGSGGRMDLIQ